MPHCARWRPSSPQKDTQPPPQFLAHVEGRQTAGWIRILLGTDVAKRGTPANFRPTSIVAQRLYASGYHLVRSLQQAKDTVFLTKVTNIYEFDFKKLRLQCVHEVSEIIKLARLFIKMKFKKCFDIVGH